MRDPGEPPRGIRHIPCRNRKVIAEELKDRLLGIVREKSYQSAIRYLDFAKRGAVLDQNYRPDGDGYLLHCEIKGSAGVQLDLTVRADNEYQLKQMRYVYSGASRRVVLSGIIALLDRGEKSIICLIKTDIFRSFDRAQQNLRKSFLINY